MPKGPKGHSPSKTWPPPLDAWRGLSARKPRTAGTGRAAKAAEVQLFTQQYARKAPKHGEPNDRRYDRGTEKRVRQMKPEELDQLLRDGEDEPQT